MATATKQRHEHIRPGEVCGVCDLRAPPVHRCGNCTRAVPDWPVDEIGCLEAAGWALQKNGRWLEPEDRVMRSPTPEMVVEAMNRVAFFEAQFTALTWASKGGIARDKARRAELNEGLTRAKDRLARLKAGERFAARPRMVLNQRHAVQMEYALKHQYDPKSKDAEVRTFTNEECDRWEAEMRRLKGGVLLEREQDILAEKRERTTTVHRQMCPECRQF